MSQSKKCRLGAGQRPPLTRSLSWRASRNTDGAAEPPVRTRYSSLWRGETAARLRPSRLRPHRPPVPSPAALPGPYRSAQPKPEMEARLLTCGLLSSSSVGGRTRTTTRSASRVGDAWADDLDGVPGAAISAPAAIQPCPYPSWWRQPLDRGVRAGASASGSNGRQQKPSRACSFRALSTLAAVRARAGALQLWQAPQTGTSAASRTLRGAAGRFGSSLPHSPNAARGSQRMSCRAPLPRRLQPASACAVNAATPRRQWPTHCAAYVRPESVARPLAAQSRSRGHFARRQPRSDDSQLRPTLAACAPQQTDRGCGRGE